MQQHGAATALFSLLLVLMPCPCFGGAVSGNSPIRKVVTLLKEMKAQVEKEAKDDATAYDKYACWCDTSEKEKTAAVENAQKRIAELEAFIEEAVGLEGQLKTEIQTLTDSIAEDQASLETAASVREKAAAEFAGEEADLKECIAALTEAVKVLGKVQLLEKHHGSDSKEARSALLQFQHIVQDVHKRFSRFKSVMQQDLWDVMGSIGGSVGSAFLPPRSDLSALERAGRLLPWEKTEEQMGLDAKPNEAEGAAAGAKSYNSRTGQVYGLLSQMKDEFEKNLSASQKEELNAVIAFQGLRASKLAEIAAGTKAKELKEVELADTIQKAAEAAENVEATKGALDSDQKFLVFLAETCKQTEEEYQDRLKTRTEELQALGEAVKILTEDDARDLFGRTMSFLQLQSVRSVAARTEAVEGAMKHIANIARKHNNWVLASLAVRIKLDDFSKVKEAIDKMAAELKQQQKAEYAKKESCNKEIDHNEDTIKVKKHEQEDFEDKQLDLQNTISTVKGNVEMLKSDVADMEISLKQAGEDRKAENQLFQQNVADQRATIQILNKALARLKQFYQSKGGNLIEVKKSLQEPGASVAPPPPKPAGYNKSAGAGGVLQLMSMIIEEATRGEVELVGDEQHAQEAYASFASNASESIMANRAAIATKTELVEKTAGELSETNVAILTTKEAITQLQDLLQAMHLDCDFVLGYFDVRQQARKEELAALAEAKAILSGADFGKAMDAADSAEA